MIDNPYKNTSVKFSFSLFPKIENKTQKENYKKECVDEINRAITKWYYER